MKVSNDIPESFYAVALIACSAFSEQMKLNVKNIARTNKDGKILLMENVKEGLKRIENEDKKDRILRTTHIL